MNFLLTIIISYLIGCVPVSLVVCKLFANKNPGNEGSTNYGALNSFEITQKWYIGVIVFLLDFIKGALATVIVYNFIFPKSIYIVIASLFVVTGHCYNVFLKFYGGKGLSTAAGCCLMFNPLILVIWTILWVLFRIVDKDIIFRNIWACLVTPLIVYLAPQKMFFMANYNYYVTLYDYKLFSILLCVIILSAHLRGIFYLFKKN